MEEIELDSHGSLWAVFEAGTKKYSDRPLRRDYPFFPLIARFDSDRIVAPEDCGFF